MIKKMTVTMTMAMHNDFNDDNEKAIATTAKKPTKIAILIVHVLHFSTAKGKFATQMLARDLPLLLSTKLVAKHFMTGFK